MTLRKEIREIQCSTTHTKKLKDILTAEEINSVCSLIKDILEKGNTTEDGVTISVAISMLIKELK